MSDVAILLALLAITTPLAAATMYRMRRLEVALGVLEVRVTNGVSARVAMLERAVFADARDPRDD